VAALLSLLIPFAIPLGITLWLGTTRMRVLGLLAFGPVAIAAWFVVALLSSPTRIEDANCHHCGEYFGRWLDPVAFLFFWLWVVLWLVGVGLGAAIRHKREASESDKNRQYLLVVFAALLRASPCSSSPRSDPA
jgi:hypothetical protein